MSRVRLAGAALVAVCLMVLTACGGSADDGPSEPKQLTQEQAELLATVRFRNYDAGVRAVSVTIPDSASQGAGSGGRLTGWVDFAGHLGYGSVEQGGAALGSVLWNGTRMAVAESAPVPASFPIPEAGWRSDGLDVRASALTQTLAILLDLGSDRPENPLLLRQSDAAFVRTDTVDGRPVVVLAGPSPAQAESPPASTADDSKRVRYWIDDDGLVLRVQLRLAGTTGWTVVDLTDAPGVTLDADRIARVLG
jgi:hypothetical protein